MGVERAVEEEVIVCEDAGALVSFRLGTAVFMSDLVLLEHLCHFLGDQVIVVGYRHKRNFLPPLIPRDGGRGVGWLFT